MNTQLELKLKKYQTIEYRFMNMELELNEYKLNNQLNEYKLNNQLNEYKLNNQLNKSTLNEVKETKQEIKNSIKNESIHQINQTTTIRNTQKHESLMSNKIISNTSNGLNKIDQSTTMHDTSIMIKEDYPEMTRIRDKIQFLIEQGRAAIQVEYTNSLPKLSFSDVDSVGSTVNL